ncbi:hypothetical protein BABINDRAFT_159606 [Babjeviella inositovora NRRL Y-12698]|uniref:SUI1 domain-containing protein n=1 Tax=Babjeviella inositovora NRRL Y-12698 TaxID=984486 RepID=A0A1E3QZV9_9ASCO|nr:uncharacterized protein BABINDRAFT_159606 [Babjeviella inositovora NRRL Y-12698]ODQ83161.1 hypothetical protein BABINDRAFT_159606 [Babjeviella inositovora NRRL Y-12698]
MPSIYTLWNCPFILPIVLTHPHVIKVYVGNGADLMLPGTVPPFDHRATKGAVVAIADTENPTVPMAVGTCNLNLPQFDKVVGRVGVAVDVIHHIGDELCRLCKDDKVPPAVGLSGEIPIENAEKDAKDIDSSTEEKGDKNVESVDENSKTSIESNSEETNSKAIETNLEGGPYESSITPEDVDHIFQRALLQSLHMEIIPVPLSSSNFMANHVLKNMPDVDASVANIKRTTWKKSAKYLKAMEKLGFLKLKGKGDDVTVVSVVGKENETVKNFVTYKVKKAGATAPAVQKNELRTMLLYKPTHKSKEFFSIIDMPFSVLYTATELKACLNQFIAKQQLVDPKNPKNIIPDGHICLISGLPRGSLGREKVFPAFVKNFTELHKIVKPGQDATEVPTGRGPVPKVHIITEMKIGRKIITRISNFEEFYIKPEAFAEELRVKCSGSTTIGPCTHNPKLTEVTVQGPHGKLVTELLVKRGVNNGYIVFEDKLKAKKRK